MKASTKVIFLVLIISTVILPQNVLHVPSQYPTIQSAVNSSQTGDSILVQPGTYYENINWIGHNSVTLISAGDTRSTIIDGGANGRVLYIEGENITVIGFSFENGLSGAGGGIWAVGDITFDKICIRNNTSNGNGGGIYIEDSVTNFVLL